MAAIKLSVRYPLVIMMIILVNPKRSVPIALEIMPESRNSESESDCRMIITSILFSAAENGFSPMRMIKVSANIVHN
ncbi:MAG TPA: hypothetical protein PLA54_06680 [Spirochaetota bacterium]|nr:hypothetical protein [Spirochaetota bacterium]HQE58866.1 hypothetical protein [Spirochaetota bacterium]